MKYTIQTLVFLIFASFVSFANNGDPIKNDKVSAEKKIKWYTWEEAVALQAKEPRIIMVDLYTDWCGWCKRMDSTTFEDDNVAKFLNEYFYPVKFNAEQKEEINYGGKIHKFVESGRSGYHELAAAMVDGKLGYPNFVYFNEKMERIMISPGYKGPEDVMLELQFTAGGDYAKMKWEDFKASKTVKK